MKPHAIAILCAVALYAFPSFAQVDGSVPDASTETGMQMMPPKDDTGTASEENPGENAPCLAVKDCDRGLTCSNGRCVPTTIKTVPACGGAPGALLLPFALGAMWVNRRRR